MKAWAETRNLCYRLAVMQAEREKYKTDSNNKIQEAMRKSVML